MYLGRNVLIEILQLMIYNKYREHTYNCEWPPYE